MRDKRNLKKKPAAEFKGLVINSASTKISHLQVINTVDALKYFINTLFVCLFVLL